MVSSPSDRRARFEAVNSVVFEPLQRYIRRRVPGDDADDVLAETLMTLWRRLDDIPLGDPLPWSYGVARRMLSNHRRARDRRLRLVDRLGTDPVTRPSPELPAATDPTGIEDELLAEAFDSLTTSDRELLRLWAWEGLEPRDISVVLGLTSNAATIRLSRARRRLGEAMKGSTSGRTHEDRRHGGADG